MDSFFREKNSKVVVVDPSGAARTLLTEIIRGFGFEDITGVPSVKDALGVLEVEPVGWLLSSLLSDQKENALHILKVCLNEESLKGMRISLLLEQNEEYVLGGAFEHGLLSYHPKPFTKESLQEGLQELLGFYDKHNYSGAKVSAEYIRKYLNSINDTYGLLNFEKSLIEQFPQDPDLLLNLVPPQVKLNRTEDAKSVLRQVLLLSPKLESSAKEMARDLLGVEDLALEDNGEPVNILGLKKVIVVDSDESIQKNIKEGLAEIGVHEISSFLDGDSALNFMKENKDSPPDLIIQEWRIPKVTGPLFLQKAKELGSSEAPFVVVSSLISDEDRPFVREMGIANVINKPIDRKAFNKSIFWTVRQDRMPTDLFMMERKMRKLLARKKIDEATVIKLKYLNDPNLTEGKKNSIEAEFSYASGDFEKAKNYGIEAIKQSGDSIMILNLLGKILMNMRQFDVALKCFEKAQSISPLNIERLCIMAEAHSELGSVEEAQNAIEKAKELEGNESERISEVEAKIAVNGEDFAKAKKLMSQLNAMENVVSYMNNQAVALAKCGQVEKGIEQYHRTLKSIPDDRKETKAIVSYNLALAFARNDEIEKAQEQLKICMAQEKSKVYKKAKSLSKRILKSLKKGTPIDLHVVSLSEGKIEEQNGEGPPDGDGGHSEDESEAEREYYEEAKKEVIATVEAKRGDVCCYLIYVPKKVDDQVKKLFADLPRFTVREAIEKDVSHGADKIMSQQTG